MADNKGRTQTYSKPSSFGSSGGQQITMMQQSNGINVHLYFDIESDVRCINFPPNRYIAENICHEVADRLKIEAVAFPIFALRRRTHKESWSAPNDEIICTDVADNTEEFMFRVRFVPPQNQLRHLMEIDRAAFNYLFLQVTALYFNGFKRLAALTPSSHYVL